MAVRKVPGDADSLFSRLKLWERELVDYAQTKHSTGSSNRDLKTTAMPRLTHASLKPGSCSSKSDARTSSSATSSSRSYQAPTLSSFAKTSRPLTGVEYKSSQQYSPPTKDKYAKSPSPVVRKSLIPPSDFESAEESPSNICQELCQVSSRLSGLVRDIHDDRLRSAVSRFCDDIGGYVSQEERRRDADVAASGSEFFMSTSSLHRHVEKLVENAVAPLQRENRELSWKVTRLEEDLRHTEESESAQAKLVAELQACVDQLKAENTRLNEEKAAGWKEVEKELAKLKDDNRRIKERMQAVVESNRILQETLQKRDNDLHELQSNTRSLIGTLMTCLDNIPPSSSSAPVPVPVNACSSASGLTVTSSIPDSVVKVDSGESNSLRIRVVKQQQTAAKEASSLKSVPKSKTKRAPSVKPSSTSIGVASTLTNGTCHSSVGGVDADAESESETELASTDSEFASEFHNNLQQLDDYLRQLRGSLEKRTG